MRSLILTSALIFTQSSSLWANEGQWQPHQMLELKTELKKLGFKIPAEKLADLKVAPMNAIVSLGGCSASFVSPKGLIVTNHHCAYGDIQQNSSAEKNLIADGFLAKSLNEELPAKPDTRVYITDKVENVTSKVLSGLDTVGSGFDYYEAIQKRIKGLIEDCEKDKVYRCSVPSFHRGMEYFLIRQLMIRDVRLVYAPSDKIGNFGGEIDNFEWPRHTGDFAFLRAYVGKDGRPADPSPDNVPYASKDFLKLTAEGIKEGDPVLLAGYPGRTSRYKLPIEIAAAKDLFLPRSVAEIKADLDAIDQATKGKSEWEVRYASVEKSLRNGMKKTEGLLDGFAKRDILGIKSEQFKELKTWASKQSNAKESEQIFSKLDKLIAADFSLSHQQFALGVASTSELLKSANTLYRLSQEKLKKDEDREPGFQERDLPFIRARMTRLEQTLVKDVDLARWQAALSRYAKIPLAFRPKGLDELLPKESELAKLYAASNLDDKAKRLEAMNVSADDLAKSSDAIMQLAIKMHALRMDLEKQRKELDGQLDRVIPKYMTTFIAWKKSQGKPVYPDANSTLRVTFGQVSSFSPVDGITKGPFTTLEGIVAKTTEKKPFESPLELMKAAREKRYGLYKDSRLGTVPVNFLSSVDTTGGNSGSAVINKNGELVGLNFDSTYESVTKDWYFDDEKTRAIHVDIRYMLWVMQEVDHADNLMKEMSIRFPKKS